jgi:hypothetical protein
MATSRTDMRARLRLKGISDLATRFIPSDLTENPNSPFNGPGEPLRIHRGILFPFTPIVSASHTVEYSQFDIVHNNYQQNAYKRTANPALQITGTFASQTIEEAKYTVGVMHFLRVASKMVFGEVGEEGDPAGTPPPILEFSAFGAYNFDKIPVVISNFTFNYDDTTDLIEVDIAGKLTQVPTLTTISITLLPQYSPAMQNKFSLSELASGAGYSKGFI